MSFGTYSEGSGITEANSFNNITDVLTVLPNNTQKLISPQNVRDAVLSSWENTVIRYTKNSSGTEYIGIARENIKDKIFLGKKSLSGTNILSNSVLLAQPDIDIFFYNTKSDGAANQNLKIGFLAGGSASLHTNIPYLEVVQVISGTPSLSLNLTHNQSFGGDFNFIAGNNGRIAINNLIFPSQTEITNMVTSASSSLAGDLYLVRSTSGYVELRTGASLGNTLGSPGSPTNIFGSPVNVNGFPLEFSESNPTLQDFGGVPQGTTFSNVPIVEVLRQLLYPYLGPLSSVNVSTPIVERNHISNTTSSFTYTLTKRSQDITSTNISIFGNTPLTTYSGSTLGGVGFQTQTFNDSYTFSSVNVLSNSTGIFTFSVSVFDGSQSSTASANVTFVYPYFYGFSATTSNIQTIVTNDLTKLIDEQDDQTIGLAGTGYLFYMFPNDYSNLSKIYDGNGFLLWQFGSASNSWTYSQLSISSPTSIWSSKNYLVYRTVQEVTIPLPSQGYQFNFTP